MKLNFLSAIALVVCCLLGVALFRAHREAADAQAELIALRAATNALAGEMTQLQSRLPSDAERARAETTEREAIKLRGELGKLKQSLAEAKAANAAQKSAAKKDSSGLKTEDPADSPYARVLQRKLTANVGLGHAVIFGGWQSAPGKQAFALATPSLIAGSPDQVAVQTKWLDISDEAMSKLDTTMLLRAAGQQTTITPEQLATFIKQIEEMPGTSVLSAPSVSVLSGRQARISVAETRTTPNGPVEFGPVMDLIPTLSADGTTVDLVVDAKLTLPNEPDAPKQ